MRIVTKTLSRCRVLVYGNCFKKINNLIFKNLFSIYCLVLFLKIQFSRFKKIKINPVIK